MNETVTRFVEVYNQLEAGNLHRLTEIYAPEIIFEDPTVRLEGLTAVQRHFEAMYRDLLECRFEIAEQVVEGRSAALFWIMHFRHRRLNPTDPIAVSGSSLLRYDPADGGRAIFHRDYFDLGALLYEHLPVLGGLIRGLRKRLGRESHA